MFASLGSERTQGGDGKGVGTLGDTRRARAPHLRALTTLPRRAAHLPVTKPTNTYATLRYITALVHTARSKCLAKEEVNVLRRKPLRPLDYFRNRLHVLRNRRALRVSNV